MTKNEDYVRLVSERKGCHRCSGLVNPADVENGCFDSVEIGPSSRWQGNLNATLMIVGQDWGDMAYFVRHRGLDGARNPTNSTLIMLLDTVGITIGAPGAQTGQHVAFFTNAILCLKKGGLQATVQDEWFINCASHLRRQIEIVNPRVVVGLGERAFRAIVTGLGGARRPFQTEVEDLEGTLLSNIWTIYEARWRRTR